MIDPSPLLQAATPIPFHALAALAAAGLYTEPTCAQAAAAYEELVAAGQIKREETTVVVLTSTGVKATPAVAKVIGEEI